MCGIVGYIGNKKAKEVLINGLFDLEYRGYDSAGIKMSGCNVVKSVGPVKNLQEKISKGIESKVGISHTRWATHGLPVEKNAHPHSGEKELVWLVHNGIIENYKELKEKLKGDGVKFKSDTDSEVLAQLIEKEFIKTNSLEDSVVNVLKEVVGAYGIVVFSDKEPDKLVVARMGSPLVLGIGKNEFIIASDITPIIKHTKEVVYLEDGEIAVIKEDSYEIRNSLNQKIDKDVNKIDWDTEESKKDGFEHFMLKEIYDGPEVVKNTIRGRIISEEGMVKLGGLELIEKQLKNIKHIHIVGCGSAYYAGLFGKYLLEELAGISVDVDYASEFRYRSPVLEKDSLVLAISQSGETADTLEAIREAKREGVLTLGIVNSVGSTIARETDAGIYNHAGPEISVASTKAYISQLVALILFSVYMGRMNEMTYKTAKELLEGLEKLPEQIQEVLENSNEFKKIAEKYKDYKNFLFIGRKYNFPIAMEGALKLKEVSYIHAEGYGAGELKHGPIALIDENMPTIAINPVDSMYKKMISNIEEIKSRKGKILIITDSEDTVEDTIKIPKTYEPLSSILSLVPLQIFSYYIALSKNLNVDRPRNLAKSVTVE
jgi:glucosamine--fructose-6-phosphate aminotransferase (isomerizing)